MVPPSRLRDELVRRILAAFEASLPIYQEMMAVAREINARAGEHEAKRLGKIMHAAIRCWSDQELRTICDLFAVLDCHPVNYYDLRARVSVESTAFRPIRQTEIQRNGFRVFCSKLALDSIALEDHPFVKEIASRRKIFSSEFVGLLDRAKQRGGLATADAETFLDECVKIFSRPETALVSLDEYKRLREINKVAAQVLVCNSLAFNHLTPSVASVPAAHEELTRRGIKTIPVWQGPVGRDVILRQTSCLAPAITLKFPESDGTYLEADYQETFVEFEERLQALTPQGRELFESLFDQGKQALTKAESDSDYAAHYYEVMNDALAQFPSDLLELWQRRLAYFTFDLQEEKSASLSASISDEQFDALIVDRVVRLVPQQYEDFFGPAATNIFNSNIGLQDVSKVQVERREAQSAYEVALGRQVVSMHDYYEQIQTNSRQSICSAVVKKQQ